jgi:peroxiredoxin
MLHASGSSYNTGDDKSDSGENSEESFNAVDTDELLAAVDQFASNVRINHRSALENEYFSAYLNYAIARLVYASGQKREQVYRDFLVDAKVFYNNQMYVSFIHEFYHDFFRATSSDVSKQIVRAVNAKRSLEELDSAVAGDLTAGETELRQLIMLRGLREAFYYQGYSRDAVMGIIKEQSQLTEEFPSLALAAANVDSLIRRGMRGYEVPDFEMLDHLDNRVKLSDFRGKYVYLGFFTTNCETCEKEMLLTKKIKVKNPYMEVISVSMDYNNYAFKSYVSTHSDQEWTFLYGPSDRMIRDYLPIRSVPEYFLIDPEGKLMYNYTRKPSEGVSMILEGLRKRVGR